MISESGRAISIRFTGPRQGEKLSEQLYDDHETTSPTDLPKVSKLTSKSPGAWLSTRDVADLETLAHAASDTVVRERVFTLLDLKLGCSASESA